MKKLILWGLILFSFSQLACQRQLSTQSQLNPTLRQGIMGGEPLESHLGFAGHVVGIMDVNEGYLCSGTLISENVVVTAAHCIGKVPQKMFIVFDPDMTPYWSIEDLKSEKKIRSVLSTVVHEKFKKNHKPNQRFDWYDMALIRFAGTLPEGYSPSRLLVDNSEMRSGDSVILAGYGVNQVSVEPTDPPKNNKDQPNDGSEIYCTSKNLCVKIMSTGDGLARWTTTVVESVQNIEFVLTESKGRGTCVGDSGGSAFVQNGDDYYLAGVTSRGSTTCDQSGVYTSVSTLHPWIVKKVSLWGLKLP